MPHPIDMRGLDRGRQAQRLVTLLHSLGIDHGIQGLPVAGPFTDMHHPLWATPAGADAVTILRRTLWGHILPR
jgi:hypothetical protein